MSEDKNQNPPQGDSKARQLTAAEAAKRVKRTVTELVDGKDGAKVARAKEVPVQAAEVLSCRDYGTHVVVVTRDGQKLSSQDE
jgi:hypothetical protein